MAADTDSAPRELSVTERPFPVVPFPGQWLAQFGGLNSLPPRAIPAAPAFPSAEVGQAVTDPQY